MSKCRCIECTTMRDEMERFSTLVNTGVLKRSREYEEGRAAGYAEAIEKAAKVAGSQFIPGYSGDSYREDWSDAAKQIAAAIRALAPAATTKEPK